MIWGKKKPKVVTDEAQVERVLTRGVEAVLPNKESLKKLLMSGKRIKLYQGFDPTGTDLHIGHMVGFRKLAQFQKLGHHVIFLVGDGTGQAGDPSGKLKDRDTFYTREQLRENAKEYLQQAGKIVDFEGDNPIDLQFNGDWLGDLRLADILNIAEQFTVQQLLERDMYQKRIKAGTPIGMREFLYPFLQGYDSVAMDVDLEIGGVDQTFNMLAGRTLQKRMNEREKFVLSVPLLTDAKGTKIGKTEGNVIGLTAPADELFGGVMSLGDDVIVTAMEYLTDVSMEEVKRIEKAIQNENPKQYKEQLAHNIVSQLHSPAAADAAQENWRKTFSEGGVSDSAEEVAVKKGAKIADVLLEHGYVESKSAFRRLVEQGAVTDTDSDKKVEDFNETIEQTRRLKVGKRLFVTLLVQ